MTTIELSDLAPDFITAAHTIAYCDSWAVAAVADGRVEPVPDAAERTRIWELLAATPPPLGYEPGAIGVPGWDGPTPPGFVPARVDPWRVQVRLATPGVGVELRTWRAAAP